MLLYKAKKRSPALKWILGGIIFIATLCITFSDVGGTVLPM